MQSDFTIQYEPIVEIPLPDGIHPIHFLNQELILVSNGKFFKERFGIINVNGEYILPLICSLANEINILTDTHFSVQIKGKWALYTHKGEQLTEPVYSSIEHLGEDVFSVCRKMRYGLLGADGQPITDCVFYSIKPFSWGLALAEYKRDYVYIDPHGNTVFTAPSSEPESFSGGYATFKKKGRVGAVDTTGRVVLPPQYKFLAATMSGYFVFSEKSTGMYGEKNFGILNLKGEVVLPPQYAFVSALGDDLFRYGHSVSWSVPGANNSRINYSILCTGYLNAKGQVILPDRYTYIGEESEGLRAFTAYENDVLTLGYMDEQGRETLRIGEIDYKAGYDSLEKTLLRTPAQTLLGNFNNGQAKVNIKVVPETVGMVKKKDIMVLKSCPPRTIDKTGKDLFPLPIDLDTMKINLSAQNISHYRQPILFSEGFEVLDLVNKKRLLLLDPYGYEIMSTEKAPLYTSTRKLCQRLDNYLWLIQEEDDENAQVVISEYESIHCFASGLAPVQFEKNACGYIDPLGNTVVEPIYKTANPFRHGVAWANRDDRFYLLKRPYKIITPDA